jgi:OOP family OmpA-OmpF porin
MPVFGYDLEDTPVRPHWGLKLGANFPSMAYSAKNLDGYSSPPYATAIFEVFGDFAMRPWLSLRPGLKAATRGQHINPSAGMSASGQSGGSGFSYKLDATYVEITFPAAYNIKPFNNIYAYVVGGPAVGLALGGSIRYKPAVGTEYKTKIGNGNTRIYEYGAYLGAGMKYPVTILRFSVTPGIEAGYHIGLSNTYSDKELDGTANALNGGRSYDIGGGRYHRGPECGLTVAVPLSRPQKTVSAAPPPAATPPPAPPPTPPPLPAPEKPCYTLDEIKELIRAARDIGGKKICAVKQINFQFGSSELTAEDKVYLNEIVALMMTNSLINIRVNGHADNVGAEEANTALSSDRAKAIHDYIRSNGIAASRLSHAHFGSTRPIAGNDTDEGRAINRRVEFEITNQ